MATTTAQKMSISITTLMLSIYIVQTNIQLYLHGFMLVQKSQGNAQKTKVNVIVIALIFNKKFRGTSLCQTEKNRDTSVRWLRASKANKLTDSYNNYNTHTSCQWQSYNSKALLVAATVHGTYLTPNYKNETERTTTIVQ